MSCIHDLLPFCNARLLIMSFEWMQGMDRFTTYESMKIRQNLPVHHLSSSFKLPSLDHLDDVSKLGQNPTLPTNHRPPNPSPALTPNQPSLAKPRKPPKVSPPTQAKVARLEVTSSSSQRQRTRRSSPTNSRTEPDRIFQIVAFDFSPRLLSRWLTRTCGSAGPVPMARAAASGKLRLI